MKDDITIDATGKKLGRLATEVALALRGKDKADFQPNSVDLPKVSVKNLDKLEVSERKLKKTELVHYSGYPGGRKVIKASELWEKDKNKLFKHAVSGMLPQNRLKKRMIKNLTTHHGEGK